jgi:hypothetical protein
MQEEEGNKPKCDELLLKGRDILNTLIVENLHRKEKSFISVKEVEILKEYESNLLELVEKCPPEMMKRLLNEIGTEGIGSTDTEDSKSK